MKRLRFFQLLAAIATFTIFGQIMCLNASDNHCDSFDFLYFTDAHRIFPVEDVEGGRGGVARLKTVADKIREINPATLLIHGGDLCGGVLFGGVYKGVPMIEAFNQIPLNISNFGQHEFDFGTEHIKGLIENSEFQWLSSNLKDESGSNFADVPAYLLKSANGISLAFLGLTDAMNTTIDDGGVVQMDLSESIAIVLNELAQSKAEIDGIVVLTQTDLETNRELLNQFPQIDLILTEEQYEYASNVYYEGGRAIVATAGNMSSVAHIQLRLQPPFSHETKKLTISTTIIALDQHIASDPDLLITEQHYRRELDKFDLKKVSMLTKALDVSAGHSGESGCGNLVTDAFRDWHDSDVGMINSGSLRVSVPAGELTIKSIRSLLPFSNKICQFSITVKDLKTLLKRSAKSLKGQLLHVSGISYKYVSSTDSITLYLDGYEPKDDTVLTVSTSDYLMSKIDVPHQILIQRDNPDAKEDYQVLTHFCEQQAQISPKLEGRITLIND